MGLVNYSIYPFYWSMNTWDLPASFPERWVSHCCNKIPMPWNSRGISLSKQSLFLLNVAAKGERKAFLYLGNSYKTSLNIFYNIANHFCLNIFPICIPPKKQTKQNWGPKSPCPHSHCVLGTQRLMLKPLCLWKWLIHIFLVGFRQHRN